MGLGLRMEAAQLRHQAFHQITLDCQHLFVQSKIERTNLRLTNNIYLILNVYI